MLCWNMISIETRNPNRTIDLIVPKQKDMDILLGYLLTQTKLNTVKERIKIRM
jgi:hypothetical protein